MNNYMSSHSRKTLNLGDHWMQIIWITARWYCGCLPVLTHAMLCLLKAMSVCLTVVCSTSSLIQLHWPLCTTLKALQQSIAFLRALEENVPSGKCFVDLMLDDILASGCRNLPVDIIESLWSDVWKSKNHPKHPFLLYPGLKHIPKYIRFELWFLPQFRPWCCVPI
jgi:hypothetical protein